MPWAVLGLGTNLGARRSILEAAIALLGDRVVARSALYATPPLGPPQPDYLNAAVRVVWDGELDALLDRTQAIEVGLGRERRVRWGPRTLDIDILYCSAGAFSSTRLRVPHPELTRRAFALAPLLDVAPELAMLGSQLAHVGGPPTRAQPSWSSFVWEGGSLCGEWLRDGGELAAQYAALSSGVAPRGPLAPRPFQIASPGLLEHGLAQLIEAARLDAFAVRGCAVLSHDDLETRGVLLGMPGVREALQCTMPRLEERADGARRFVTPDRHLRSVDSVRSGTMP